MDTKAMFIVINIAMVLISPIDSDQIGGFPYACYRSFLQAFLNKIYKGNGLKILRTVENLICKTTLHQSIKFIVKETNDTENTCSKHHSIISKDSDDNSKGYIDFTDFIKVRKINYHYYRRMSE